MTGARQGPDSPAPTSGGTTHLGATQEAAVELLVYPDAGAAAVAAAELLAASVARAVDGRNVCTIAFSGGRGPAAMLRALARHDLPWESVHVFQVDERAAPHAHSERNLTLLRSELLDHVAVREDHVHPMPVEARDLDEAAAAYAQLLASVCDGRLDVVHLGLGEDGHTASWPPGDPVADAPVDVAATATFNGYRRLTLTPGALADAGVVVWLVTGGAKCDALTRLLDADPSIPASRAPREHAIVVADADAAPPRTTLSG